MAYNHPIGRKNATYIPLIVLANGVIICYLPLFLGNQKQPSTSPESSVPEDLVKLRREAPLPPEVMEPLAAFRGDVRWHFEATERLEQKLAGAKGGGWGDA